MHTNTTLTPVLPVQTLTEAHSTFVASLPEDSFPAALTVSDSTPELELWLAALESFLQIENLPAEIGVTQQNAERDWSGELRIIGWGLLKCSQLASGVRASEDLSAESLVELQEVLCESDAVCQTLASHGKINYATSTAWSEMLADKLQQSSASLFLLKEHERKCNRNLPEILEVLNFHPYLQGILGSDVRGIFGRLFGLLERLRLIEKMLKLDQPLKPTLLLFALLQKETRNFLIQAELTLTILPAETPFYEVLDGVAYVVPMEVRKVFNYELVGVSSMRQTPWLYARAENACGLLKDCFQQAAASLAQVFAPNLQASEVFPDLQIKIEESLVLRRELWLTVKAIQKAEKSLDSESLSLLGEKLIDFRENTMPFLMFKDIETTERFIEEVIRTHRDSEIAQVLHRFSAYLETLFGQVNMRNVLMSYPFDYERQDF